MSYSNTQFTVVVSTFKDPLKVADVARIELAPKVVTTIVVDAATAALTFVIKNVVGAPGKVFRTSLSYSEIPSFKSVKMFALLIPAATSPS